MGKARVWVPTSLGIAAAAGLLATGIWYSLRKTGGRSQKKKDVVVLKSHLGMEVHILANGAAIQKLLVPNKNGSKTDVVLGYETAEEYLTGEPVTYFGAVVGRVANRIASAQFKLEGNTYKLLANNGPNALHGGALGLHRRIWEVSQGSNDDFVWATLRYSSPDGEEGYPGTLDITVTYRLARQRNELMCEIHAVTDQSTPVNIAQHSYFNLAGHSSGQTILNHMVHLPNADHYTPLGPSQIPTGEIVPVSGTPFDFTEPKSFGARLNQVPGGYDHNYVLFNQGPQARFITQRGVASVKPKLAATVWDPKSGRALDILTTAPGMQLYSGNFLDDTVKGKGNTKYFKHAGFCMETQGFPDSVNKPSFPSVIIQPSEAYNHHILYKFYNK